MEEYFLLIITALIMGTAARIFMMKIDYRQYPTYPQSYLGHFTLGIIAAALGAVTVPAMAEKEFVAITFIALAAQHFRDVRSMERESLDNIEVTELVPRGTAYIEDIAKGFEARNYLALLTSLATGIGYFTAQYLDLSVIMRVFSGVLLGGIVIYIISQMLKGSTVEDIAEVIPAEISFDGPLLTIGGVIVMNIGLKESQQIFLEKGIAIEIIPKDEDAMAVLANIGQRQAIQHNASTQLGIRKDVDEPDFTPIARRNPENGNIVMAIITMNPKIDCLVEVVKRTPVLESSKRKALDIAYKSKSEKMGR